MDEISTRFKLTLAMLGSVIFIVFVVMIMAAIEKPVPDFISGVVLAGFMLMLKELFPCLEVAAIGIQEARASQ